jgi:hypothetical protein
MDGAELSLQFTVQGLKQVDSHSNLLPIFLQLANQIAKECEFISNKNVKKSQIAIQTAEIYFVPCSTCLMDNVQLFQSW